MPSTTPNPPAVRPHHGWSTDHASPIRRALTVALMAGVGS